MCQPSWVPQPFLLFLGALKLIIFRFFRIFFWSFAEEAFGTSELNEGTAISFQKKKKKKKRILLMRIEFNGSGV
jgi:hypothetical protein